MNRRLLTPLIAVLAATAVSGCTTFSDNDAIARVGDTELSSETLEELATALFGVPADALEGPNNAADIRQAVSIWVAAEGLDQHLAERQVAISETDRATATELIDGGNENLAILTGPTKDFLIDYVAGQDTLAQAPTDHPSVEALYNQGIRRSNIACISHILVESEEEANDIVAELADGADFATLAAERSTDPGSGANGGSLGCSTADQASINFVPEFAEGALNAAIGEPTAPVQSDFGFHVILLQPFDQVDPSISTVVNDLTYILGRTDVNIDPRYGKWDSTLGVVPIGS